MLCSSLIISNCEDQVIFVLIHLTGELCSHSSSFILSSFASLFNLSAVWNPSYPLCHSFNSSGGSVLLISSSILSSYQVLIQFLLFSTGVLPEVVVPCYSFLTECFLLRHLRCILFSYLLNLSRFFGFSRLSKKQLSFTSSISLPFALRCHSRSRDEILS